MCGARLKTSPLIDIPVTLSNNGASNFLEIDVCPPQGKTRPVAVTDPWMIYTSLRLVVCVREKLHEWSFVGNSSALVRVRRGASAHYSPPLRLRRARRVLCVLRVNISVDMRARGSCFPSLFVSRLCAPVFLWPVEVSRNKLFKYFHFHSSRAPMSDSSAPSRMLKRIHTRKPILPLRSVNVCL